MKDYKSSKKFCTSSIRHKENNTLSEIQNEPIEKMLYSAASNYKYMYIKVSRKKRICN